MNETRRSVEEVRALLGEKVDARGYRGFSAEARRAAAEFTLQRVNDGGSTLAVARELGMKGWTLQRWVQNFRRGKARPVSSVFRRVKVKAPEATSELKVKGPCGVVVEGLTVKNLAALLRELSCSA